MVAVLVVGGGIHMEPLPVHVDQIPCVVAGADGDAGYVRRPAQETERSGIGAASRFQLPGVWGEGIGHARRPASVVGQQGPKIIVEVRNLFPVCHPGCGPDDGLDKVIRFPVVLRHGGGHREVVQVLPVVGEVHGDCCPGTCARWDK